MPKNLCAILIATCALTLSACPKASAEERGAAKEQAPASAPPTTSAKKAPAACARPGLPQSGLSRSDITIHTGEGAKKIEVERCETPRQQQVGMMCRTGIDDEHGMIFVFPRERTRSFWMKNTLIALDMIFIDADGTVVSVLENAEPLTTTSRKSLGPAQYVLEVRGGFAKTYGVHAGDRVDLGAAKYGAQKVAP